MQVEALAVVAPPSVVETPIQTQLISKVNPLNPFPSSSPPLKASYKAMTPVVGVPVGPQSLKEASMVITVGDRNANAVPVVLIMK